MRLNIEKEKLSSKFLTKNKIYRNFGLNIRKSTVFLKKDARLFLKKNLEKSLDAIKDKSNNIKFLKEIRSYRGNRHKNKLPTRGQRTHTNARTAKKRK